MTSRFIVSPEDAAEMEDLRAFTRDLVKQMEHDLGTRLDWVALDHWHTDKSAHLISSCAALTITATPSSSIATTSVTHTPDLFPESSGYPDKANAANIRLALGCFSRLPTFASPPALRKLRTGSATLPLRQLAVPRFGTSLGLVIPWGYLGQRRAQQSSSNRLISWRPRRDSNTRPTV
jgi:hypothetical protein